MTAITAQCCVTGGGPAGMMLGILLARAGVEVAVLEKHQDFLRDFRGDTIHPSTLELLAELGWLDDFLKVPHQKVSDLFAQFGTTRFEMATFRHLPVHAPFIAMVPQWDFLNFLADKGRRYPGFGLMMRTEGRELISDSGRIVGVKARGPDGDIEIRAALTVAADGRNSTLRPASGLEVEDFGAPMDVLWFRLPRTSGDTEETQARFEAGQIFIMLNRGDYWQCAYVIAKGSNEKVRAAGLDAYRRSVGRLLPFEAARANAIQSWDEVKLLTVQVNRLKRWWRPGFLCIGDAAHAMSPVGGVGVNLAVQDAVAAANALAGPLRSGQAPDSLLAAVEKRRAWPAHLTQRMQLAIQNTVIAPALQGQGPVKPPALIRILNAIPGFDRIPGRVIGLGVRREHIRTPEFAPGNDQRRAVRLVSRE